MFSENMFSVLYYFVLIVLASLIPEGQGKILPQLWLCYGLCIFHQVYQGDNYFSFHIFFCLQQLNFKFEVIAQVSPTNIKCNESFISSKFRKEGRLSKVNFRKKNRHCLFNDHARWMSCEAHLNSTKMACLVKL